MLKSRLLTAFSIGPLILWAVYAMPEIYFALFSLLLVTLGAWEWAAFANLNSKIQRTTFLVINLFIFVAALFFVDVNIQQAIIVTALIWWALCLPLLLVFPFKQNNVLNNDIVKMIMGCLLLLATMLSMVLIRNNPLYGSGFALYLIMLIWFADSGAYFAGRSLGKNKLLPKVSPGKTWEGVAGALVVTLIVAFVSADLLDIPSSNLAVFITISMLAVVYSVVGDLSESMFKRMADVKDSSHLIPGHGGMLDRIDSLMAAFPVFLAGLWLMESVA